MTQNMHPNQETNPRPRQHTYFYLAYLLPKSLEPNLLCYRELDAD